MVELDTQYKHFRKSFKNLVGYKINNLTVIEYAGIRKKIAYWKCICDCGNIAILPTTHRKRTKSCKQCSIKRRTTHGRTGTKEYKVWQSIIRRCTKKNATDYKSYGGKGIKVCNRWLKFENFFSDMGVIPSPKHTIDRFPVSNGDYMPNNCRWATWHEKSRNKCNNVVLTIDGKSLIVSDWSKVSGIKRSTIAMRLKSGWDHKKAVFEKALDMNNPVHLITIDEKTLNINEWSKISGVNAHLISNRLRAGWTERNAIFQPIKRRK